MNPGEIETYEVSYNEFKTCIDNALKISEASGDIQCNFSIGFSHNLYTKLLMNCIGIFRLCPNQNDDFWDFFSISTLTRSLLENYAVLHYMNENNSDSQQEDFKFKLALYHWDCEKYAFYKELNADKEMQETLEEFERELPKRATEIENHPFFFHIPKDKRKKILQGKSFMLKGHYEILKNIDFGNAPIAAMYRFYSNYTHSTAFSTMTISNDRGRGIRNEAEVGHISYALEFSKLILFKASKDLMELLPDMQQKIDKDVIDYFSDDSISE